MITIECDVLARAVVRRAELDRVWNTGKPTTMLCIAAAGLLLTITIGRP